MDTTFHEEQGPPFTNSSTPLTHLSSRKRRHDDTLDFTQISPRFSSTLNDSLIADLKEIKLRSIQNTPEKQRSLLNLVSSSPIQESRKILYRTIKQVKPEKKLLLLPDETTNKNLWNNILNIDVVMDIIFKYLSGGDLYRFSLVSRSFLEALQRNRAFKQYKEFKIVYKHNKENYQITPPGSPEKCDSPPRTTSVKFNKFLQAAKHLNHSQSLNKCRKCGGVSVIENDISQCQNINSCGLIHCLRCPSYSETGAQDFKDGCGRASLRPRLGNVSNQLEMSGNSSSFFNFSSQDSGFYSENEVSPKVKRNLFSTSCSNAKALAICNRNKVTSHAKRRESISFVPVVINKEAVNQNMDCQSPPRYRDYPAGSKQSKKNLKRLTG